jgi:hypothetical protein
MFQVEAVYLRWKIKGALKVFKEVTWEELVLLKYQQKQVKGAKFRSQQFRHKSLEEKKTRLTNERK